MLFSFPPIIKATAFVFNGQVVISCFLVLHKIRLLKAQVSPGLQFGFLKKITSLDA